LSRDLFWPRSFAPPFRPEPAKPPSFQGILLKLKTLTTRMGESDRTLLLDFASRLASRQAQWISPSSKFYFIDP
jgi:hypothetical protein